jgi:hypothetical protein
LSLLIVSDSMWALLFAFSSVCSTLVKFGSISVSLVFRAANSLMLLSLKFSTKFAIAFSKYAHIYISPINFITVYGIETAQFRLISVILCGFVRFPFPKMQFCSVRVRFLY